MTDDGQDDDQNVSDGVQNEGAQGTLIPARSITRA
jgi:hypothetical protein